MPGTDLLGGSTGFRDLRGTQFENTDPNFMPMAQDSLNVGWDYQLNPRPCSAPTTCTTIWCARSRTSASLVNGEQYLPASATLAWAEHRLSGVLSGRIAQRSRPQSRSRSLRRAGADVEPPLREATGSPARTTRSAACTATTRASANTDEVDDAYDRLLVRAHHSSRAAASRVPAPTSARRGISTAALGFAREPDPNGPARDRPAACREALRRVHVPVRHADRAVPIRWERHAGQTYVIVARCYAPFW